jgi:pyruvate,orthophosphate dikinase
MQARALFEAAVAVEKRTGKRVKLEIMVPLVAYRTEFEILREVIVKAAAAVEKESRTKLDYLVGTMIELPRAALRAGEIAEGDTGAAFFSFGTNDLTQTTLGLSRDDAAPILEAYAGKGIFSVDPFVSIDVEGVGELVRYGVERGRAVKPGLKVGICGEHGGDPKSVAFFESIGLDYVSCSPYRVPIARLAAAQAAINERSGGKAAIDQR